MPSRPHHMVIVVDTREQQPLDFSAGHLIESATLPVGDYGAKAPDGSFYPLFFERKSLADLYGTVTSGHERFRRLLLTAQQQQIQLLLGIECSVRDVSLGFRHSQLPPDHALKVVFTWWLKYGMQPVFCQDRKELARFICLTYAACERQWRKGSSDAPAVSAENRA